MKTSVIFDMDGLLLDTEPLWCVSMNRVAEAHGIVIPPERFSETTGLRIYEVCEHWSRTFPWDGAPHGEVAEEILDDIIALSKKDGGIMPGVVELLDALDMRGIKIGLASSSPLRMIEALIEHFGLRERFHCVTSADAVAWGKPHPAVFLHCADLMDSAHWQCTVLEDSVNGCIAGKAARMKVVAVPHASNWNDARFSIADVRISTLSGVDVRAMLD